MSHDEHPAALTDQLHQGIGRHTGTHLAAVIRFPVPSAVEIEVDPILDDRLIAATAQRHLDAQGGKVIAFLEALAVHAQADGNGGGQAGGIDDLVNVFQQGKLVLLRPFQVPLLENEQETVALQPAKQAAVALRPPGDGFVQLGVQRGNGAFRQVFGQFLIIVDENDGDHRPGADILVPHLIQLRQVGKIQHAQHGAPVVLRPDGGSVYPVTAVAQNRVMGAFCFSGGEPVQGEVGQHLLQPQLGHGVGVPRQLAEAVVAPDDVSVPQTNHHRRQGRFPAAGGFQGIGSGLDILLNFPFPTCPVQNVQQERDHCHRHFSGGQPVMPHQQRRSAESGHHEKVCTHPGSEQSSQLSIHCQTSSFRLRPATDIHTIPDIIANPAKRCNSFSVKSVKKTAKKLYTFSRNCVILYVPAPGTGFTRAFGRRGRASRKEKNIAGVFSRKRRFGVGF